MAVIDFSKNTSRIEVVRSPVQIGSQIFSTDQLYPSIIEFNAFWDFMETINIHGYTRAAMSVIGRSAIGTWWTLREHPEYGKSAREIQRKRLYSFYMMFENHAWNNIKDYHSFAYKLMIGIMYLRYFGQCGYQIIRNKNKSAIGLDFLPGLVMPNVDEKGFFKNPAFTQYISKDPLEKVDFRDPRDIVYIINPDWQGSVLGGSDLKSLAEYTLPLDLYLLSAAMHYMENRDRPEGIYNVSPDLDDDAFESFVRQIRELYTGAANLGRNPIVAKGECSFEELRALPESLPYQEARANTRDEILAVSGTTGAKLGLSDDISNANLREIRREYHETSMIPLFRTVELGFYEQVHVREFDILGWELRFNQPDFLTAVEQATVDMRYHQMGVYNPNEIRYNKGMKARTDPNGDLYYDQIYAFPAGNQQGSPPEGRPVNPDNPAQVGEPNTDDGDPERGDDHDDTTRDDDALIGELHKWRSISIKRIKRNRALRPFQSEYIPRGMLDLIQGYLSEAHTVDDVVRIFELVFAGLESGV